MTTPEPEPQSQQDKPKFPRRNAVMLAVLAGALALISSTQTWLTASDIEALPGSDVSATGQDAAAVVPAMALVAAAAGVALSITRKVGRIIIGVLLLGAAAMQAITVINVLLDPEGHIAPEVAEATGLTDPAGTVEVSWYPWLCLFAAVLLALAGVCVLVFGHTWKVSRKYERHSGTEAVAEKNPNPEPDDADSADDLAAPTAATTPVPSGNNQAAAYQNRRSGDIDAWDELSRGNDPT